MQRFMQVLIYSSLVVMPVAMVFAQDNPPLEAPAPVSVPEPSGDDKGIDERATEVLEDSREQLESIKEDVNQSATAQEVSAGILKPIYLLAERMAFPSFHWTAFALMTAGVVGYALQLVLTKLVLLSRMSFSLSEIFADSLGLVISLVGLVLTTQAAAENSSFTRSPAAVLSATAVGVFIGFIHYRWGQAQEIDAATGRRRVRTAKTSK